jgi:UDP-N-acetylglucosamine 3-dehydrogenase
VRVGVIGVGSMGQHHARIYSEMSEVELVGVMDVNPETARFMAKKYNTTPYTEVEALLRQNLDAVSVVVPTTLHKDVTLKALEYGAHVLVEKPISNTLESADEMINAARDAGLVLSVGHIERFNPAVVKLKQIIEKGTLGKIVSISAKRVGPYNPRIRDVGIIMDLGVHDIDVISHLYGRKINAVYTIAGRDIHSFEDHATILLKCDNNLSGMIETNWLTPHKIRTLSAIGLKGVAYLDYLLQSVEIHDEQWIRKAKIEQREPLKNELECFLDTIRGEKTYACTGEEGRHALEVSLAAIESYQTNKIIEIL